MNNERVVSNINSYLHNCATLLSGWLNRILPKSGPNWWQECVIDNLSDNQREIALEKGFSQLVDFDLAALLKIATKNWYVLRNYVYLQNYQRDVFYQMMKVRNNWAHCGAELPGKDAIVSDLETTRLFLLQLGSQNETIKEVEDTLQEIKSGTAFPNVSKVSIQPASSLKPSVEGTTIKAGDTIRLVGRPEATGYIISVETVNGKAKYLVFTEGSKKTFYEGQVELIPTAGPIVWSSLEDVRSHLSAYQINNPSGRDLYSLNAARIDFVPYQFRPALKIIHSDEPRILIADSVGVGKTIEAGLIIKELSARQELQNILVICPKPLVAERKWEEEMKRFDATC